MVGEGWIQGGGESMEVTSSVWVREREMALRAMDAPYGALEAYTGMKDIRGETRPS